MLAVPMLLYESECYNKILNRFEALGNLNDIMDINRARENIRENIHISPKESPGHYELEWNKL